MRKSKIRMIALANAVAMAVSMLPVIGNAETKNNDNVLSTWGNSNIAIGSDFAICTGTDGNSFITDQSYNNINFSKLFSDGHTIKVVTPTNATLGNTYAMVLKDDGSVKGYRYLSSSISDFNEQIKNGEVSSGAVDLDASDNKVAVVMNDGTVKFNETRKNEPVQYNSVDGEHYEYPPKEDMSEWENIKKVDIEDEYVLGIGYDGGLRISNSKDLGYELITSEVTGETTGVEWVENWDDSSMSEVKQAAEKLSKVKDADGTKNIIAYVKDGGKCGIIGGDLYGVDDEVATWTKVEKIYAFSNNDSIWVLGVREDGTVIVTTEGTSLTLGGVADECIEKIISLENVQDLQIVGDSDRCEGVIVKHKDLACEYIAIDSEQQAADWISDICRYKYDKTIPIKSHMKYIDEKKFVEFMMDDSYRDREYALYIKKVSDNNEMTQYRKEIEVTEDTEFEYYIAKTVNGVEMKSPIHSINVKINDDSPVVKANVDSGVVSNGTELKFRVEHNGAELNKYKIKYVKVPHQTNEVIRQIEGYDNNNIDLDYILDGVVIAEYTEAIKIDKNCDIFVWAEANEYKTPIQHYRYTTLGERPNIYPEVEYNAVYSNEESQDLLNGYRVTRRNSMMVKSDSYMSAALSTTGEVWSNKISTISKDGMSIPIANVSGTPSSSTSDEWKATRMWRMISDIAVGEAHVVGLKIDGTVVASGNNESRQCEVGDWTDIVDIAAGRDHTVGLKKDGTVIGTSLEGNTEDYGQTQFATWNYKYDSSLSEEKNKELEKRRRVIAIDAGNNNTVGLRNDGTVVAAGNNDFHQCDVDDWTDIVDIAIGTRHTVGLKSDGTVVAIGDNNNGQCDVSEWKDVVQISASAYETIGITYDGNVLKTGIPAYGGIHMYGSMASLISEQPVLLEYLATYSKEDGFDVSDFEQDIMMLIYPKDEEDQDRSSYSDPTCQINIYDRIHELYSRGVKFKYASSGNYVTTLIDEEGLVYNLIYAEAPDNPSDTGYPITRIDNNNGWVSLNKGPTIINNYDNGAYNTELNIKLESTIGEANNILWSKGNTDVYAMGTNSNNLSFDGASILNIAPYKLNRAQKREHYPVVYYFYLMETPVITFSKSGMVSKGEKIAIDCSRPTQYKIFYTEDGYEPSVENIDGHIVTDEHTKQYTGAIEINEDKVIKAQAYCSEDINSQPTQVYAVEYKTISEGSGSGTLIDVSNISEDTVFTKENSPYYVVNNLTIDSGAKLILEAGVEMLIAEDKSITINGVFESKGEANDKVSIHGLDGAKWNGIRFASQSGNNNSILDNIIIKDATTGLTVITDSSRITGSTINNIELKNNDTGINIQSNNLNLYGIIVVDSNGTGIIANSANTEIKFGTIKGNAIGINVSGVDNIIESNDISNNTSYGILLNSSCGDVGIEYNSITGNNNVNSETGKTSGYNVGFVESGNFNGITIKLNNNNFGFNTIEESRNSIQPSSEKTPKVELEDIKSYAELIVSKYDIRIDGEKGVVVSKYRGLANDSALIIGVYSKDGALNHVEVVGNRVYSIRVEADMKNVSKVKVFNWDSLDGMKPMNEATEKQIQ